MIEEEYGTPDEDNPEWTVEKFAQSMKFKDLPESLQRTLSSIQQKRMRGPSLRSRMTAKNKQQQEQRQTQIPFGNDKREKQWQ